MPLAIRSNEHQNYCCKYFLKNCLQSASSRILLNSSPLGLVFAVPPWHGRNRWRAPRSLVWPIAAPRPEYNR